MLSFIAHKLLKVYNIFKTVVGVKMDIEKYQTKLAQFAKERNWDQFHSPKNLSMALTAEAGELLELFQWLKEDESKAEALDEETYDSVKQELADIFIYLMRLADKLGIDLEEVVAQKISINADKYSVKESYDNAVKYNRRK